MAQTTEIRAETAIEIGVGNTAVAIAVDSTNLVGIHETAPTARFEVSQPSPSTGTVSATADDLLVRGPASNHAGMTFMGFTGFGSYIDFASTSRNISTYIRAHNHTTQASERMDVYVAGTERIRMQNADTIFNRANADVDFRAETTGLTYGIHVDAGNDAVGIGGAASASYTCQVTGTLNVTGAITGSSCCSDEALKANITPLSQRISGIRNRFMGLVPIRYDWNPAPWIAAGIDPPDEPASFKWGFSAQNVEAAGLGDLVGTVSIGNFLAPEDPQIGSDEYQEIGGVRTGAPHVYKSFDQAKLMPAVVLMTQWLIDHAETTRNQLDVAKTRIQTLESQMAQAIARIQSLENA